MASSLDLLPNVVTSTSSDGTLLAVPVQGDTVELARAAALRGDARALFERFAAGGDLEALARALEARGAPDAERARADAESFLHDLGAHGLAPGHGAPPLRAGDAPLAERANGAPVDAAALEALVRAALARGYRLRFAAQGRSMRPRVPHGAVLVVAPRAFADVRLGEVALYRAGGARLVAHRVVGRRGTRLLARGDSAARLDELAEPDFLGVVVACETPSGHTVRLSDGVERWTGLASGLLWRAAAGTARALVLRPLRGTLGGPSVVRRALGFGLRAGSALLTHVERLAGRARTPLDVARAALLTSDEKDVERRRLYARRSVQGFTALDENVEAGLTLLEEVLLARHGIAPGRALVLGCGPGRECLALARRGFTVTGVDREEGMLERARTRARAAGVALELVTGDATSLALAGEPYDVVVLFSGLYDMILPRAARVRALTSAARHLRPGGKVLVTFLSAYAPPDAPPPAPGKTFLEALNPEHERGDAFLLNEVVHVFPRAEDVAAEARDAGLVPLHLARDQRAYDRAPGRVKSYAVLEKPA